MAERIPITDKMRESYDEFRNKLGGAFSNPNFRKKAVQTAMTIGLALTLTSCAVNPLTNNLEASTSPTIEKAPVAATIPNELRQKITQEQKNNMVYPNVTATPIQELKTNSTQEPTITPTLTPEMPFFIGGIDFAKEGPISFEIENLNLVTSFIPMPYNTGFTPDQVNSYIEEIKPGKGTVAVVKDRYGNTILLCHSGYSNRPLECEGLREFIEGGSNTNPLMHDEGKRLENMNSLIGQVVKIGQSDGTTKEFIVSEVAYVPHESVPAFLEAATKSSSLDVVIEVTGGQNSPFLAYREGKKHTILLTFCGWGPRSKSNWWEYSRYIIALEPKR
jgi:hypothetical protein